VAGLADAESEVHHKEDPEMTPAKKFPSQALEFFVRRWWTAMRTPFRVDPFNFALFSFVIGGPLMCAASLNMSGFRWEGLAYVPLVLWWLWIPCRDRQFGKGRPFFYVRQTVIVAGALLVALAACV
jgi:hypothetical protein